MKILTVTHLSTLYGANRSLLNLIQGTRHDIKWIVICRGYASEKPSLKSELISLGIPCYNIPFRLDVHSRDANLWKRKPFFVFELIFNLIIALFLSVYASWKNVSVVHSNSSSICLGAFISYFIKRPHIWHFREFLDEDYRLQYNFGLRFLKFWADKAYRVIAISKTIEDKCVLRRGITSTCVVLYNGVISANQIKIRTSKIKNSVVNLLILGVLDETKNQLDAIKAVEVVIRHGYNIKLNIVGGKSGSYYKVLQSYVIAANLDDSINFIDYVPSPEEVITTADIVLVCSKNEGMGRVTLESMAYGVPVIGYDGGGTSELIRNNFNGLLYKDSQEELAEKIILLIEDDSLYINLLKNGQTSVIENYTVEIYSEKFLNLIK